MEKTDYDRWHDALPVDARTDAPWHGLLKSALLAGDLADKRILEIGCGRGGFACWIATQPHTPREVVAADFASVAVEKGRAFASDHRIERIDWQVQDIQAIKAPDASFDTVISCETIEHVPDPAKAVRELTGVLKPGGRLFLTTPNYFNSLGLYRIYLRLIGRRYSEQGQPINNFMLIWRTRKLVTDAGLHVQKLDAVVHQFLFPGRMPKRLHFMDGARPITKWTGVHSMILARKPM